MRTREPRGPDAGADGIDARGVRDHRDLGAVAGLAGHVLDLDEAVGDLRHLELEQRADQLGRTPRDDDARSLRLRGDVGDDRLHARAVVVALAAHLLGAGQQRLHALAQLDEGVARVGLLDDAGDQLAHAVLVLVEHHVALRLADALEDHLLGGLRRDAAEVLGRHVALLDLVRVLGKRLLGRARAPRARAARPSRGRSWAPPAAPRPRPAAAPPARRAGAARRRGSRRCRGRCPRARTSPSRGSSCRPRAGRPPGRPSACRRRCPSPARGRGWRRRSPCSCFPPLRVRLLRRISVYGIVTSPPSAATMTSSSEAPTSSPVKLRCPSLRLSRAHASLAADEATEVLGLDQRALRPGRGDLEARLGQQVAEILGHQFAQLQASHRPDGRSPAAAARRRCGPPRAARRPAGWPRGAARCRSVAGGLGSPWSDFGRKKGGLRSPPPGAAEAAKLLKVLARS